MIFEEPSVETGNDPVNDRREGSDIERPAICIEHLPIKRVRRTVGSERVVAATGVIKRLAQREAGRDAVDRCRRGVCQDRIEMFDLNGIGVLSSDQREAAIGIGQGWIDRNGAVEAVSCLIELSRGAQAIAQAVPGLRMGGVNLDDTTNACDRARDVAGATLRAAKCQK